MKFDVSPKPSYVPPQRVFASFWSGIGSGFQGNYGSVRTYLPFQFQMNKKEREICEFEMDFKKSFLLLL